MHNALEGMAALCDAGYAPATDEADGIRTLTSVTDTVIALPQPPGWGTRIGKALRSVF